MTNEFTLTWTLDADPADVFRAWTEPEHLDWFYNDEQPRPDGPIELDLRIGGVWRQLMVIDANTSYFTGGMYREIVPDERLVTSETYEGLPEGVSEEDGSTVNTATFTEVDGRTTVTLLIQAANRVSRDAIIETGMEDGLQDALDLAEEVAVSLA